MTQASITTSRPDQWTHPRPYSDATMRRLKHGAIRPMERPGFFQRLFGA